MQTAKSHIATTRNSQPSVLVAADALAESLHRLPNPSNGLVQLAIGHGKVHLLCTESSVSVSTPVVAIVDKPDATPIKISLAASALAAVFQKYRADDALCLVPADDWRGLRVSRVEQVTSLTDRFMKFICADEELHLPASIVTAPGAEEQLMTAWDPVDAKALSLTLTQLSRGAARGPIHVDNGLAWVAEGQVEIWVTHAVKSISTTLTPKEARFASLCMNRQGQYAHHYRDGASGSLIWGASLILQLPSLAPAKAPTPTAASKGSAAIAVSQLKAAVRTLGTIKQEKGYLAAAKIAITPNGIELSSGGALGEAKAMVPYTTSGARKLPSMTMVVGLAQLRRATKSMATPEMSFEAFGSGPDADALHFFGTGASHSSQVVLHALF
jgi:hypothetical protein